MSKAALEFLPLLEEPDVRRLDLLITLATVKEDKEVKIRLCEKASEIAWCWYKRYWNCSLSVEENLHVLGISTIRPLSSLENISYRARALYDPETSAIALSEEQLTEMEIIQDNLGLQIFTAREMRERILIHELFHHLEETKEQPLDKFLQQQSKRPVHSAFRDVGAYAFANRIFAGPLPCQLIDFIWMMEKAPRRLRGYMSCKHD